MAHQTEIVVNGVVTEVTEFDHTAQEIDDSVDRAMLSLLAVAAAAAYNPSGAYAVGDYCTNDGNLYKCNTPIESGEPWNAAHWTATTVAAELDEVHALLAPLGGATTPQAVLAALGAGVQDNDLINPFFEVNQRGVTEWTGGYGVDCWTNLENKDTAKITVGSDGEITLTSTVSGTELGCVFSQFLERVPNPGEKYTLSFFGSILSGTVRLQLFNGTRSDFSKQKLLSPATDSIFEYTLEIPSTWEKTDKVRYTIYQTGPGVVKIKAAKKEPGDKQTLGYKDSDGAWHLLPQPGIDYATQLAKCQRYLYALESITMCPGGVEDDNLIFGIRFPVEMRIAPVFIGAEGGNNLQLYVEGSFGFYENQNFTLQWSSRTGATIKCQSPISLPPNPACNGRIDGKLMFSAEL